MKKTILWEAQLRELGESGLRAWWDTLSADEKRASAKGNMMTRKVYSAEVVISMARARMTRGMAFLKG
jgi:hypothetical protein